jgi:PAS domain-containing protein
LATDQYIQKFWQLITNKATLKIVGVSRNINERKITEKALIDSEDKFRKIADTSPVAMSFANKGEIIGFVNRWVLGQGVRISQ